MCLYHHALECSNCTEPLIDEDTDERSGPGQPPKSGTHAQPEGYDRGHHHGHGDGHHEPGRHYPSKAEVTSQKLPDVLEEVCLFVCTVIQKTFPPFALESCLWAVFRGIHPRPKLLMVMVLRSWTVYIHRVLGRSRGTLCDET